MKTETSKTSAKAERGIAGSIQDESPKRLLVETVNETVQPLARAVAETTKPLLSSLAEITAPVTTSVLATAEPLVEAVVATTEPLVETVDGTLQPLVRAVAETTKPLLSSLAEITAPVTTSVLATAEPLVEAFNQTTRPYAQPVTETTQRETDTIAKVNAAPGQTAFARPATGTWESSKPPRSATPALALHGRMPEASRYLVGTEMTMLSHKVAYDSTLASRRAPVEAWAESGSPRQPVGPFGIGRLPLSPASTSTPSGAIAELLQRALSTPPAPFAWLFTLLLGLLWMRGFFGSSTLHAIRERPG